MENISTVQQSDNVPPKPLHIFVFFVYGIRFLLWFPALFLVYFLLRMEVKERDRLKDIPNGRVIFAANHTSELDPYAFQYSLPFLSKFVPLYFVSLGKKYYSYKKFGVRSFFYGGIFFNLMGAYPVYKGIHDFEKAFINHIAILKKNRSVLIFPQGTMVSDLDRVRPGFVFLAKRTQAPVVPVRIDGLVGLTMKDIFLRRGKVVITFGEPIPCETFTGKEEILTNDEMQYWAQEVMKKIKEL